MIPTTEKTARERDFHNKWASRIDVRDLKVIESFEACTAIENRFALEQMGDLRGKKILDIGCGAGETSVYFALKGADVYACDISEEFLKRAVELAAKHNVPIKITQADSSHLPFDDDSFDFVFGNGVLHHVELEPTGLEVMRVLKKEGKALFIEPLPYNPVINVYRALAKEVRTEDERPLGFGKLRKLKPCFSSYEHKEFWFASLLIFFHFFFIRRWHPGKVRYWKKVIEDAESYKNLFATLQAWDRFLLKTFPFLRPLCWNTVLVLKK